MTYFYCPFCDNYWAVEQTKAHSMECAECGREVDEVSEQEWLFLKKDRGHIE